MDQKYLKYKNKYLKLKNLYGGANICAVCGEEADKQCSGCHKKSYCSVEHQKIDWPTHKITCGLTILPKSDYFKQISDAEYIGLGDINNYYGFYDADNKPIGKELALLYTITNDNKYIVIIWCNSSNTDNNCSLVLPIEDGKVAGIVEDLGLITEFLKRKKLYLKKMINDMLSDNSFTSYGLKYNMTDTPINSIVRPPTDNMVLVFNEIHKFVKDKNSATDFGFSTHLVKNCKDETRDFLSRHNIQYVYDMIDILCENIIIHKVRNLSYNADYIMRSRINKIRDNFRKYFSYAIPDSNIINEICKFISENSCNNVLEIGAGLGLWAALLREKGINIFATDNFTSHNTSQRNAFIDIETRNGINALKRYHYRNYQLLMIIWPNYEDDMAYNALNNFKGNYFIYIGELKNGCCATDDFFDLMDSDWTIRRYEIRQWPRIHDSVYFCTRK